MSETRSSRLPTIALGAAALAVALSALAAFVVITRDHDIDASDPTATAAARPRASSSTLVDHRAKASDVYALRDEVEVVVDAGRPRGLRVADAALARSLGLGADDIITAISGRPVTSAADVADVLLRAGSLRATMLYAEVERGSGRADRVLLRWELEGTLLEARRDAIAAHAPNPSGGVIGGPFGNAPGGPLPGQLPQNPFTDPDPLQASIDQINAVDDSHATVPRKALDQLLANASLLARQVRVVPAMKNGLADGYKLFTLRPSSALARLGFKNGDTVHTINGVELAELDDVGSFLVDAKNRVSRFDVELTRRGQPLTLRIEITR